MLGLSHMGGFSYVQGSRDSYELWGQACYHTFPQKSRNDKDDDDDDDGFNYKSGNYQPHRVIRHDAATILEESR